MSSPNRIAFAAGVDMGSIATASEKSRVEPAAFIVDEVGDVSRPTACLTATTDLRHLRGKVGLVPAIQSIYGMVTRGIGYHRELAAGNPPVFRGMFGPLETVYVTDAELIAKILQNDDGAWSAALGWLPFFDGIDPTVSGLVGLLGVDFDAHRELRRLVNPAFAPGAVSQYLDVAYPMFEARIDRWLAAGTVSAKDEIRSLLAAVAGRIFVGLEDEAEQTALDRATKDTWATLQALSHNSWLDPNWRKAKRGYRTLVEKLEPLVAARRHAPSSDLLGRIASFGEAAPDWLESDAVRARLVLSVLLAAFDTTAYGLASMTYLLAKHPEWQERLRNEALALGSRRITVDEARSLELADRAWKETLRIYPVAGAAPRRSLAEVELGGHTLPAGTLVMASFALSGLDARYWSEPDRFDPDRFAPGRAEDRRVRGAYSPFGLGTHACIGMQLANAEARAFVHALVTRARFRLAKDYQAAHTFAPLGVVSGDVRIVVEPV